MKRGWAWQYLGLDFREENGKVAREEWKKKNLVVLVSPLATMLLIFVFVIFRPVFTHPKGIPFNEAHALPWQFLSSYFVLLKTSLYRCMLLHTAWSTNSVSFRKKRPLT